ncbi:hypothetical protein VNO77_03624 [Canavalia gladiata]|uniref:Uncharacterized protein n=1 Tax=Canavalia gladiata TaxID=3824 RepID=A0AAN9MV03_CANGL
MNELETHNEELRNEVAELKEQLARVMKLLEKNKKGSSGVEAPRVTNVDAKVEGTCYEANLEYYSSTQCNGVNLREALHWNLWMSLLISLK